MLNRVQITDIIAFAIKAGDEILDVYHSADFGVESKVDDSPLTQADKRANDVITDFLQKNYAEIPILSEEGTHLSFTDRKNWEYFWLVDPLDGTKEFIKKNDEFTVNIALIHNGQPVIGVIYAPVLDILYVAKRGLGSFKLANASKQSMSSETELLNLAIKLPIPKQDNTVSAVASRSHLSAETEEYLNKVKEKYGEITITSAGSSLKLCLVAEGKAEVYPRFAPTMEWDTGAGQAIVEQANGTVINTETNEPVVYNKENLLNPWFIVKKERFDF
ncbi:3'(2'),5'-bisphosphate nucleotidase [Salipaludibacillus neizhouensis]|uniref:3'(2'),5'-bisphosphate nucleotidase CysQ n=1 Tax=Salipaludibacillus neizhouensis TaxID=885475 RepID=A0A3A9KBJ8_9BACI|nr:3'(2'),5'-bisphosphate nucleotidase CysQ [Salipaludibacillus neizhouensis]RKL68150.1 3'(2'),5'-bisphosphate nucleotidase [Salipaludibacillus neizhouensis]